MANEDRLIRADDLMRDMCTRCNEESPGEPCGPCDCFIQGVIAKAKTVDAVEVVHGRWKFDTDGDPYCSVCNKCAGLLRIESGNYCPNCGAKMDGGEMNDV